MVGPARVLTNEEIDGGVTILISETACRPATNDVILRKQILELRPRRKRRREVIIGEGDDSMPFEDDFLEPHECLRRVKFPSLICKLTMPRKQILQWLLSQKEIFLQVTPKWQTCG